MYLCGLHTSRIWLLSTNISGRASCSSLNRIRLKVWRYLYWLKAMKYCTSSLIFLSLDLSWSLFSSCVPTIMIYVWIKRLKWIPIWIVCSVSFNIVLSISSHRLLMVLMKRVSKMLLIENYIEFLYKFIVVFCMFCIVKLLFQIYSLHLNFNLQRSTIDI